MGKIYNPGDIEIKTLAISSATALSKKTVSILPQLIGVTIYSNLFDKFINGEVIVKDGQNIRNLLPLVGNEVISIHFETPSLNLSVCGDYYIYKMSESYKLDKINVYTLYFISMEGIAAKNSRISKTFRGDPIGMLGDIVYEKGLNSTKQLFTEIPKNRFAYISNYWNAVKNIDYISEHSLNENDSPTYLFYETLLGFHFNSIDKLTSDKNSTIFNFIVSDYEKQMEGKTSAVESLKRDYAQVQEASYKIGFNFLDRVESGFYGGRTIKFDPISGRYVEKQIEIENEGRLNEFSCVDDNFMPASNTSMLVFSPNSFNNIDNTDNNTNSDYIIRRNGILSRLRNQRVIIKVFGRSDYIVGSKVNLKVSRSGKSTDDIWDTHLSGNYLITAVKHQFSNDSFYSYLELSRGSYQNKISNDEEIVSV